MQNDECRMTNDESPFENTCLAGTKERPMMSSIFCSSSIIHHSSFIIHHFDGLI